GDLDGVRVDHVDGLLDPAEYLRRLQRGYVCRLGRRLFEADRESQNIPDRLSTVSRERWKNAGETLTAPANSTVLMDEPHHDPWTDVEPHFLRRLKERLSSTDGAIRPV